MHATPRALRRLHGWATIGWLVAGTAATLGWLADSVAWVSWMSLYAIVVSHWAAWQAARTEVKQDGGGGQSSAQVTPSS